MIREKTLLCKLNELGATDAELFGTFQPSWVGRCPGCGAAGGLRPHGSYTRFMISINGGTRLEETVGISRSLCPSCKKTQALLPDILIPHSSHTLRFIIHVLRAYLNRDCTVAALCERYQIAVATLYRWKHRFREHANLLLAAFKQIRGVTASSLDFIQSIVALPSVFHEKYGFSFLQGRRRRAAVNDPG